MFTAKSAKHPSGLLIHNCRMYNNNNAATTAAVRFTTAPEEEGQLNIIDWNYGEDLDVLKAMLSNATGEKRGTARDLIATCMKKLEPECSDGKASKDTKSQKIGQLVRCRNPLQIDLILDMVLSYIPVKSLLTARLVNRTWNAKALPWIQKKTQKPVLRVSPVEFQMFCAEFDCAEVFPFGSLEIILQGLNKDACHKFFTKHGSKLQKLKSHEHNFHEGLDASALPESLRKLQYIFRQVSNLKALDLNFEHLPKLGLFDFDEGKSVTLSQVEYLKLRWMGSLSQGFLSGLFNMLPRLKVIELEMGRPNFNEQDWEIFGNSLRQKLSLHTIHFPRRLVHREAEVMFRSMATPGSPKLKELTMPWMVYLSSLSNEELGFLETQEDLLRSQSDNLEVLSLTITYNTVHRDAIGLAQQKRKFPILKNLKTATFDIIILTNEPRPLYPHIPIEPEDLPKLQTLCVVPETMETEVFADSLFLSVQEVKLCRWSTENIGILTKIGSRFPNLRKLSNLEISVNVKAMEIIVTSFPDIEDLELKIVDDPGEHIQNFNLVISGIPAEKWDSAQDQLAECSRSGYKPLTTWIDQPGPSLRDLKSLKRLVLECDPFPEDQFAGSTGYKSLPSWIDPTRASFLRLTRRKRFILFPFPQKKPRVVRIDEIGVYLTFLRLSPQLNLTFRGLIIPDELAAKLTGHYQNIYFLPVLPKETQ